MNWLSNLFTALFGSKPNPELAQCYQDKATLTVSLADRTEEYNSCFILLAKEQSKTASLEAQIGQLDKENQRLTQELSISTDAVISLTRQIKELNYEHAELVNNLNQEIWELKGQIDEWATLTPMEKAVHLLAEIEPSAEAWFELVSIISDYMKVRGVQTTEASAQEVDNRLKTLFPNATIHRQRDNVYFLPTKAKGLEIIARDWTNLVSYIAERRDCDDFSKIMEAVLTLFYALNNAFEIWSHWHSFIVLLFSDGEVILEPQTDLTFQIGEAPTPLYEAVEIWP